MSCKTVYSPDKDAARDELRALAITTACRDAGRAENDCPPDVVLSTRCKGEARPKEEPMPGDVLKKTLSDYRKAETLRAAPEAPAEKSK